MGLPGTCDLHPLPHLQDAPTCRGRLHMATIPDAWDLVRSLAWMEGSCPGATDGSGADAGPANGELCALPPFTAMRSPPGSGGGCPSWVKSASQRQSRPSMPFTMTLVPLGDRLADAAPSRPSIARATTLGAETGCWASEGLASIHTRCTSTDAPMSRKEVQRGMRMSGPA